MPTPGTGPSRQSIPHRLQVDQNHRDVIHHSTTCTPRWCPNAALDVAFEDGAPRPRSLTAWQGQMASIENNVSSLRKVPLMYSDSSSTLHGSLGKRQCGAGSSRFEGRKTGQNPPKPTDRQSSLPHSNMDMTSVCPVLEITGGSKRTSKASCP